MFCYGAEVECEALRKKPNGNIGADWADYLILSVQVASCLSMTYLLVCEIYGSLAKDEI